jgi:biotin synthase
MNVTITDIINKSQNGEAFVRDELIRMLSYPAHSAESFALMAEARRISEEVSDGKAEVHGQFALDLAPCACNCQWCSFAKNNHVFKDQWRISPEDAVEMALGFERQGANAVLIMTTAAYPFGLLLDMAKEIRKNLKPDTVFIANTSDKNLFQAQQMKEAGFDGVYHALRLREGTENDVEPAQRLASIRNFQTAGLRVGTCVEPIGPEHANEEIANLIHFTASLRPAFSGAARRIPIPGTAMAERGMISELRMAHCVAVTRIAMPRQTRGNCTHEPCTLGAAAGATLFWAEMGPNPRDDQEKTETNRGKDVKFCVDVYRETGWEVLDAPSMHFNRAPAPLPGIET